jgi:CheY-like chemotaxis protein
VSPQSSADRSILLVEDSEDLRELMSLTLEADGHRVLACADADTAYAIALRDAPGLVITDINLGATSGFDLITRLRARSEPAPPIIACSAVDAYEDEAMRRGAAAFLRKPFDRDTLRDAIGAAEQGHPLTSTAQEGARGRCEALRREAFELADGVLAAIPAELGKLEERALWSARWLPRYFGIDAAVLCLVRQGELRTVATSDPARFPADQPIAARLPLAQNVLQAASSILIPDVSAYGLEAGGARTFAGVPFFAVHKAVGAACMIDDRAGAIDAEGLALLQIVGRRASAHLSQEDTTEAAAFWSSSGWLTRQTIELLLALEVRRGERDGISLALLAFECSPEGLRSALAPHTAAPRTAVGELGPERFVILFSRAPSAASAMAQELDAVVASLSARCAPRGLSLVSFTGSVVGMAASLLLEAANTACTRSAQRRAVNIERLDIRHEVLAER